MKVAYSWLKDHINFDENAEEISAKLTASGLEVEGIEETETIKGGLKGVVVGEVLTCEKHPNADKLSVTTVNVGTEETLNIVCGAPNVAAGQKVLVATVGTTLYPNPDESFKIKKAKVRGVESLGMICAEDELGLGNSHDGIMVLDSAVEVGTPAAELFDTGLEQIIEIGLTPNRADGASHYGVARDIKALTGNSLIDIQGADTPVDGTCPIEIEVTNQDSCPRYAGVLIKNIKIQESPEWLKKKLLSIDITPKNNVVDITNYILHDLGQPLHAFDADKIAGNKVIVGNVTENTPFTTLDEVERKLKAEDLMICDSNNSPLCIGGVLGGLESGVSDTTTTVFLESAYFSPDSVRKSSLVHTIKTDAAFRFERGTDVNMVIPALRKAVKLIEELGEGKAEGGITDVYSKKIDDFKFDVRPDKIRSLLGANISTDEIKNILTSLDISIDSESDEKLSISVPSYRVDVKREADIAEEVLRIYGFENIPLDKNLSTKFLASANNEQEIIFDKISEVLISNGFYESITNSLSKPEYSELIEGIEPEEDVQILNKLSEDLGIMRQSLLFTGLEVLSRNINRKQETVKIFEFGKIYKKVNSEYIEEKKIALWVTGLDQAESWKQKSIPANYFTLSSALNATLERLGVNLMDQRPTESKILSGGIDLICRNQKLGFAGKVKSQLLEKLKIEQDVFYAELDFEFLMKVATTKLVADELSKFPQVRRDLSVVIDKSVTYEEVKRVAQKTEKKLLKKINVFDTYDGEKLEDGKKSYSVSFILENKEDTLTDKVIDKSMNKLINAFEKQLDAVIRR